MNSDDAQLMQRVQDGEHDPFAILVNRYREALCRVAFSKLGDRNTAEDVVQETFLAVYAARHTYNSSFAFRTWLWTILLNLCKRNLSRQSRRPREFSANQWSSSDESSPVEPATGESGLTVLLREEQRGRLMQLLRELPEAQGDALRLRFFGELTFPEIADAMNSSLSGAKVRVRKGLEALAGLLTETKTSRQVTDAEESSHEL